MQKKTKNDLYYFWTYYKWQICAAVIVLFLVLYFIGTKLREKETVVSVMLLDCHSDLTQEVIAARLADGLEIDTKTMQVEVQSTLMLDDTISGNYQMTSLSRFLADLGSEKLDVCGMLLTDFQSYDSADCWADLREVLPEETLVLCEDYLVYGESGRVIGIDAQGLPGLLACGCYDEPDVQAAVGVIYNTKRPQMAAELIKYLALSKGL